MSVDYRLLPDRLYSIGERSPDDYSLSEAVVDAKIYVRLLATCESFKIACLKATEDKASQKHVYQELCRLFKATNLKTKSTTDREKLKILQESVSEIARALISENLPLDSEGEPKREKAVETSKPDHQKRNKKVIEDWDTPMEDRWIRLFYTSISERALASLPDFVWSGNYQDIARRLDSILGGESVRFIMGDLELVHAAIVKNGLEDECPEWLSNQFKYVGSSLGVVTPYESLAIEFFRSNYPDLKVEANVNIGRYECDIVIEDSLIVELDPQSKSSRKKEERDGYHSKMGYQVFRVNQKGDFKYQLEALMAQHFSDEIPTGHLVQHPLFASM